METELFFDVQEVEDTDEEVITRQQIMRLVKFPSRPASIQYASACSLHFLTPFLRFQWQREVNGAQPVYDTARGASNNGAGGKGLHAHPFVEEEEEVRVETMHLYDCAVREVED